MCLSFFLRDEPGIISADGGALELLSGGGGKSVAVPSRRARSVVGVVPQTGGFIDLLTPLEHLCLHARLKGFACTRADAEAVAAAAAAEAGLPRSMLRRRAGRLSGGNQRKLMLAIALLGRPWCVRALGLGFYR